MHELRCLDRTQLFGRRVRVIRENRGGFSSRAFEVSTERRNTPRQTVEAARKP